MTRSSARLSEALSWDDLKIIRTIGDHVTLTQAAAALGLNVTTVVRRLSSAEGAFGARLFDRRRTGCAPTAAGHVVIELARRVEADISSVSSQVASCEEDGAGVIRLATSDSLLEGFAAVFRDFRTAHPATRIETHIENSASNLARGDCDVAIRATNAPPENLVGRKLAVIAWAPYERRDATGPTAPDRLFDRDWVSFSGDLAALKAVSFLEQRAAPQRIIYRTNSVSGAAAAIKAGVGAGYLPCMLGDLSPELTRLGPPEQALSDDLWLLTHPAVRHATRVRSFADHFYRALASHRPLIEGRSARQG